MSIESAEETAAEYERLLHTSTNDILIELVDYVNAGKPDAIPGVLQLLDSQKMLFVHEGLVRLHGEAVERDTDQAHVEALYEAYTVSHLTIHACLRSALLSAF